MKIEIKSYENLPAVVLWNTLLRFTYLPETCLDFDHNDDVCDQLTRLTSCTDYTESAYNHIYWHTPKVWQVNIFEELPKKMNYPKNIQKATLIMSQKVMLLKIFKKILKAFAREKLFYN